MVCETCNKAASLGLEIVGLDQRSACYMLADFSRDSPLNNRRMNQTERPLEKVEVIQCSVVVVLDFHRK